jgi:hypothetical protein
MALEKYQDLWRLRQIARDGSSDELSDLEKVFLSFSEHTNGGSLVVKRPKLFHLGDEQKSNLKDALHGFGITLESVPSSVDITGAFDITTLGTDKIIIVSPQQFLQDHYSNIRSYLNPLIEQVYSEAASLLSDFTLHEAISGQVKIRRGCLDLKDVKFFPERFSKGPYQMTVRLDTAKSTIEDLAKLYGSFEKFSIDPKLSLLDKNLIDDAVSKATALRKRLGALSRYALPETTELNAETDYCILQEEEATLVYLYCKKSDENLLVCFGKPSIGPDAAPSSLKVLNGHEHQDTLLTLVRNGIFEVNENILDDRLKILKRTYDQVIRTGAAEHKENYAKIAQLIRCLDDAKRYFKEVINPEMRSSYISKSMPEALEFMLCPRTEDPILYELLPRLSWNGIIRGYHQTDIFTKVFGSASDKEKADMVHKISKNMIFSNYQNYTVNNWLYENHQELCRKEGIRFEIIS